MTQEMTIPQMNKTIMSDPDMSSVALIKFSLVTIKAAGAVVAARDLHGSPQLLYDG